MVKNFIKIFLFGKFSKLFLTLSIIVFALPVVSANWFGDVLNGNASISWITGRVTWAESGNSLTTDGNVGIGTTSPTAPLTINTGADKNTLIGQNSGFTHYNLISLNNDLSNTGFTGFTAGSNADLDMYIQSQSGLHLRTAGGNDVMAVDSGGRLSFGDDGLDASTLILDGEKSMSGGMDARFYNVYNGAGGFNRLQVAVGGTSADDPTLYFAIPSGSDWSLGTDNSDSDSFKIASTNTLGTASDRLTITTGGNVGIGTTNPQYKLDVAGTINAQNILINGQPISTGSYSPTTGSSPWSTATNGIHYSSGNVGIGTAEPKAKLHIVNGDLFIDKLGGKIITRNTDGLCYACGPDNNNNWLCQQIACPG